MRARPAGTETTLRTSGHAAAEQHDLAAVALEEALAPLEVLLAEHDEPPLAGQVVQAVVADEGTEAVEDQGTDAGPRWWPPPRPGRR